MLTYSLLNIFEILEDLIFIISVFEMIFSSFMLLVVLIEFTELGTFKYCFSCEWLYC